MNHVFLVGAVEGKPDIRKSQNGTVFVTIKVLVEEKRRDGTVEHTCFPVELFGDTAGKAAKLVVGQQVICEGRLKMRAWDFQGKKGASMQFMCWNLIAPVAGKKPEPAKDDMPPPMCDDILF